MRRSLSNLDPWSGQVCLPGGKEEAGDENLLTTACRETMEELGIDLTSRSRYVGSLDDVQVVAHGRVLASVITPHVFVQTKEVEIVLGTEASASFWLPLASALAGELDSTIKYRRREGGNVYLPSWRLGDEQIWGLTYNILRALLCLGTANKVGRLG